MVLGSSFIGFDSVFYNVVLSHLVCSTMDFPAFSVFRSGFVDEDGEDEDEGCGGLGCEYADECGECFKSGIRHTFFCLWLGLI
jgi:hypothetical protein